MIKPQNIQYLQQLIYNQTGVIIDDNKQDLITSRLKTIASEAEFSLVDDFLSHLQILRSSSLHLKVIDALMTNETQFFREKHIYEHLQNTITPALIKQRSLEKSLNIWSAACSTGQEPYSIAISLCEENYVPHDWQTNIFASDISANALNRAKKGIYSDFECSRGLPVNIKEKYFTLKKPNQWQIKQSIKNKIRFERLNIIRNFPELPLMDVIFLRNILIYFDAEHKSNVLKKIIKQLKPSGYLIVGTGETPEQYEPNLKQIKSGKCIFYQLKNKVI